MVEESKETIERKNSLEYKKKVQWMQSLNNMLEGDSEWNINPLRG